MKGPADKLLWPRERDQEAIAIEVGAIPHASRVLSFLGTVAIDKVKREWPGTAAHCFTPDELVHLTSRSVQTAAGFLAVKRALLRMFTSGDTPGNFCERDFALTHTDRGAPRLLSIPQDTECIAWDADAISISISHTKVHAYGFVSYQEDDHA